MTLEDISPHISTNANIIWLADTNLLPKSIWTYRKLPQTFSQNTVSNILPLCGFQMNPFPKSFKKQITLWDNVIEGDPRPDYFAVVPELGFISFARERRPTASGEASTNALVQRTWQYAQLIGLDKTSLTQNSDALQGRTVSLGRTIDDIGFLDNAEGLCVRYTDTGAIDYFYLS